MIAAHGGPLLVDEDGFVAIIDAKTYRGFVDADWTLEQLAEHFARERDAEHAVIVHPGPDLADAPVTLAEQPPIAATRSYSHPITVTDGRLHLTDYTTQRYSDAPPARMRVLIPPAFAAAKLSAWVDRHAPRDLYDMWALAELGIIDDEAKRLFRRLGPALGSDRVSFEQIPDAAQWNTALQHQGIIQVSAEEAAEVVRRAWR